MAAAGVVAYHYTGVAAWGGQSAPGHLATVAGWAAYGAMGVPLFFVISGFVVLMTAWGRDIPEFVASRVGRLFPAYWATVLLLLVLVVWPEDGYPRTSEALLNLTMFQKAAGALNLDAPFWTLWVEACFYLLIAAFILIGITRQRVLAFAMLWPLLGNMALHADQKLLTDLLMPGYSAYFAGGMLLYLLYRDGHDLVTWLLLGMQALFALSFATGYYGELLPTTTGQPASTAVIALVSFASFGLVALVTLTRVRHLNARWMTTLGALTYPVYLIHYKLGFWVIHELRPVLGPWAAVGLAVVCALVAAAVLHNAVEKPLGGRLRAAVLHALRRGTAQTHRLAPPPSARVDSLARQQLADAFSSQRPG
jgi:peptidoglycan/LPS O-acetylase OafA/YrhL